MNDMKCGLILGSVYCLFTLIWFIAENSVFLSEYPLYVSILMMIGLYVVGVLAFTGMYSLGSYLLNN